MRTIVFALGFFILCLDSAARQPSEQYPVPVSEYAEKTAPNTITFLSYPKYYRMADGELTEVVTNLVLSAEPDWDYEVTRGIWTLRVRTDGTFQASHKGDVFTYRLADVGVGRGAAFRSLGLGWPQWDTYQVVGDLIRWSDVFPDVDLTVRYIHNVLKVNVIVKRTLRQALRSQVAAGELDAEGFLTARFDIPQVIITSEARQGGEVRDLYAEPIAIDRPLQFLRDGQVIHALRPAVSYVLDDSGLPMLKKEAFAIRTAQLWQLFENAPGVAEISAHLGDLASAPEGDVAIDPTTTFTWAAKDTVLVHDSPDYSAGPNPTLQWTPEDHALVSWWLTENIMPRGVSIIQATQELYLHGISGGFENTLIGHQITQDWEETATWNNRFLSPLTPWSPAGGYDPDDPAPSGATTEVSTDEDHWRGMDVTVPARNYFNYDPDDLRHKGFLFRMIDTEAGGHVWFFSKESDGGWWGTDYWPRLTVTYAPATFGSDAGNAEDPGIDSRQDNMRTDNLEVIRFFAHNSTLSELEDFVETAYNNEGMKVVMVFACGAVRSEGSNLAEWFDDDGGPYSRTPSGYAEWVNDRLVQVSDYIDGTISDTVIAAELGNEEDGTFGSPPISKWPRTADQDYRQNSTQMYNGGDDFAEFYIAAHDEIKKNWHDLEIISGGSISDSKTLSHRSDEGEWVADGKYAAAFISGFIDGVTGESDGSLSKLPDTIAIHGYPLEFPPEDKHEDPATLGRKTWLWRMEELQRRCNRGGYHPNLAVTEYGVIKGATLGVTFSERAQAIHYMRRCLMDATIPNATGGNCWRFTLHYQHPSGHPLYGMFNDTSPFACRSIRKVARNLLSGSSDRPGLGTSGSKAWIRAATDGDYSNYESGEETLRCGWVKSGGEKWGAVWVFDKNTKGFSEYTGETRYFEVPISEADPGYARSYRFTDLDSYDDVDFSAGSIVAASAVGSVTRYQVSDADENPVFLRFGQ